MAVHFVYRCYYNAPGERHVRRFEADTILDWFRSIWKPIPQQANADQHARELLGGLDVGLFGSLFQFIAEESLPPPETMDQVLYGFWHGYIEKEDHSLHHLQILTEDDDNQVAVYLFDDHFRVRAPGLTDFLLLDGWELPTTWSEAGEVCLPKTTLILPSGEGEGTTYAIDLYTDCRYNLEDLSGGSRVEGARVPDLCRYVLTHPRENDLCDGLGSIRCTLRDILAAPGGEDAGFLAEIRDHPGDWVHWAVYSDWLQERGRPPAGLSLLEAALGASGVAGARESRDPAFDLVKVAPHVAQACKHEGRGTLSTPPPIRDSYTQWIFFDDRWVAAHPTLAAGILQFAAHWDVLSTGPREGDEG